MFAEMFPTQVGASLTLLSATSGVAVVVAAVVTPGMGVEVRVEVGDCNAATTPCGSVAMSFWVNATPC